MRSISPSIEVGSMACSGFKEHQDTFHLDFSVSDIALEQASAHFRWRSRVQWSCVNQQFYFPASLHQRTLGG